MLNKRRKGYQKGAAVGTVEGAEAEVDSSSELSAITSFPNNARKEASVNRMWEGVTLEAAYLRTILDHHVRYDQKIENTMTYPISPPEYVCASGINIIVRNAGTASFASPHSISLTNFIIIIPTITSAGPTAQVGTLVNTGVKNMAATKHTAVATAVNPVLPPSFIPAVDSMYVVIVVVPIAAPTIVDPASTKNALYSPSNPPFSSANPAYSAIEYIDPVVSRMSTYKRAYASRDQAGQAATEAEGRDGEEERAFEHDGCKRCTVGERAGAVKAHHVEGEKCVGAHSGGEGKGKIREDTHGKGTDGGGSGSRDNEVAFGFREAAIVARVALEAAVRIILDDIHIVLDDQKSQIVQAETADFELIVQDDLEIILDDLGRPVEI
ncbi:hypothetical protein IEQ34_003564 [Dendrobium chrysotoxum]|uniref:Uncharacterized protein n=1 Tax=Dendrobium chrysotoxum TaxID=161865 RepID=A0AAV7HIZ8_DENCH|nr:hypothetical protein IEQ34_003564 [Dendrobium chrysotoxum]